MNGWQAAVLGLVEGITEYLPVSSTGHLIIASGLMGLQGDGNGALRDAVKSFEIVIQGGAILAVLGLYWPRYVQMLRGLVGRDAAGRRLLINLVIAFVPFVIVAKLFHEWAEAHLMKTGPVTASLIVGGVYMIAIEQWHRRRGGPMAIEAGQGDDGGGIDSITPVKAAFIGVLQCFALFPGTSRSMMTITGGMLVGVRPAPAAEFSFLLGLPTLAAATVYSLYKNLSHANGDGTDMFSQLGTGPIVIGLLVAAISAGFAVKWLVSFLNRHGLTAFGWYRIVLGVCLLGLVLGGVLQIGE